MSGLKHRLALFAKQLLYGRTGEPYRIAGRTLRYVPGTRPVRTSYAHSSNAVNRFDALQVIHFARVIKEGDCVIDIGAHAGQYTLLMAMLSGEAGTVVAFEPDPYARQLLEANLRLNPRLRAPTIEASAVSDKEGRATLFSMGGDSRSSLARTAVETAPGTAEPFEVPTVVLDAYLSEKCIKDPSWVKIDTEGAEIRILAGARALLESRAGIVCELHPYAWAEFGNTFEDLRTIVARSGRRIRYIDEHFEMNGDPRYGTVLLERVT